MKLHTHRSAVKLADWMIETLNLSARSEDLDSQYRDRLILNIQYDGALDWFLYLRSQAE